MPKRKNIKGLEDASRDDLEALVRNIVETGDLAVEDVRQRLYGIMHKTGEKAKTISRIKVLTPVQTEKTFAAVKERFLENMDRHEGIKWEDVEARLRVMPKKAWSLYKMQMGEPDVIGYDQEKDKYIIFDCSAESPLDRRYCTLDRKGEETFRKRCPNRRCTGNAMDMAQSIGLTLPDTEFYIKFQQMGTFDMKSMNRLLTPAKDRKNRESLCGGHGLFPFQPRISTLEADNAVDYIGFRGILLV